MSRIRKILSIMLAFAVVFCGLGIQPKTAQAATNYVTVTKSVNPMTMTTVDQAEITLKVKAAPPVNAVMPNDVILIIDKSGSMTPSLNPDHEDKIAAAKAAAKGFIDLMDLSKHRVGIVSYSSANQVSKFDLTTDAAAAKNYVDTIVGGGGTDTGKAIETATQMLSNHRPDAQPVIVILTDGAPTIGPDGKVYPETDYTSPAYTYAKDAASAAKNAGVVFYTIALLCKSDNPDTSAPNNVLKEMATTAFHHHFVLGSVGLDQIYAQIVQEIGKGAAYNVVLTDTVTSEFEIVPGSADNNIPKPTISGNTLTWKFNELHDQELTFTYKIKAKDTTTPGVYPVSQNSEITYLDYAGVQLSTAVPSVDEVVKYPAPVITSIVEDNGLATGGQTVTIGGVYFRPDAAVTFGTVAATNVQVVSPTQITATVPAGSQGTVTVTVKNGDGQSATTNYKYWAIPTVDKIEPNSGLISGGTAVQITGTYFMNGIQVKFGDLSAASVNYNNATFLTVYTPAAAAAGPVDVVLTNPDGTSVTVANGFTYTLPPAPTVTSITPNSGSLAGGEFVYIEGTELFAASKIYFGTAEAPMSYYYGQQKIRVKAPAAASAGAVDVTIVNPDGQSVKATGAYTYLEPAKNPAPTITTVSPSTGKTVGGEFVYIGGTNFVNSCKVFFGNNEAQLSYYYGPDKIRVKAPAGSVGPVDITVTNPDNQSVTLINGYTYYNPAPAISSLSPASGLTTGGTLVSIAGDYLTSNTKVYFGGNEAAFDTFFDSTKIRVAAPAGTAGVVDVKVVNPDGQSATLTGGYTYTEPPKNNPTITAISPASGYEAGGDFVYIEGTNLTNNTVVMFGSAKAQMSYYYGATKIRVKAPAGSLGSVDVTVTNTDGQSFTVSGGYTYIELPKAPAPTITSITPGSGSVSGGYFVYIQGTNLASNTVVMFGSAKAQMSYYYGATKIRVKAPAGAAGPVDVKVINSDGQSFTVTAGFTYNP